MSRKLKAKIRNNKLKIFDETGNLIDSLRPLDVEDTLEVLTLKFGKKKKGERDGFS